ncbi:hypothetical protein LIER_41508 [Lithospermum erythrorhizon]|uniref:Uncharacterized protein n=1 Tax=Lithospermum erythrorhizon TaxID=34254 RepID=A0AAV3REI1_LITER
MIDATTGQEALKFIGGSLGYNQICMDPADEELMTFRTPKESILLQSYALWTKECWRHISKSHGKDIR